jgi:hypothetical protein
MTLLWTTVFAAIVITLLVMEQIAVLYVLSTLSLTALLLIVAFSDLRGSRTPAAIPPPLDDAAAISDGITQTAPTTSFAQTRRGGSKNR